MDRYAETARVAREEKEQAEQRLKALEAGYDQDELTAIEGIIGDIGGSSPPKSTDLDDAASPGHGAGERYSVQYYKDREAEVATPSRYSGAYAAALERNRLEARERAALEVKDAQNRALAAHVESLDGRVAEEQRPYTRKNKQNLQRLRINTVVVNKPTTVIQ